MDIKHLPEVLLHYFWQHKHFDWQDLRTTQGQVLQIQHGGLPNPGGGGPDFMEAKLYIEDMLWVGQVEIHRYSSDWYRHRHERDPAYENVILHVVYQEDKPVYRRDGSRIPCLSLAERLPKDLLNRWLEFLQSKQPIACAPLLPRLERIHWQMQLERMAVERLEHKTTWLRHLLTQYRGDWQTVFYQALSRGLGLPHNAEPMELLARQIPWRVLQRHRHNLEDLEALLLGQAGFLEDEFKDDPYAARLQIQHRHLRHKYSFPPPLDLSLWRLGRIRPAHFPSLRLAQLAALIHRKHQGFDYLLSYPHWSLWRDWLNVDLGEYWLSHYRPGLKSPPRRQKHLGEDSTRLLVVNVLAPLLFLYGRETGDLDREEQALNLLEALRPEDNQITRLWQELGFRADSARSAQAMIQLYKQHCQTRNCARCPIAHRLLGSAGASAEGRANS